MAETQIGVPPGTVTKRGGGAAKGSPAYGRLFYREFDCKECGQPGLRGYRGLAGHVWMVHRMRADDYWSKHGSILTCPRCGKVRDAGKYRSRYHARKFCSWYCANRAKYKGRLKNTAGYIEVNVEGLLEPDRRLAGPMVPAKARVKRVLEHRLVMARYLGRPLTAFEQVHHRNGNRADNHIENLEFRVGAHGSGASADALVCPHCGKNYV